MSKAKLVCVAMLEAFKKGELPRELFEGVNVGDVVKAGDVKIHVVPAMHSREAGGRPVGYVLEFADGGAADPDGDSLMVGAMAAIQEYDKKKLSRMRGAQLERGAREEGRGV